MSHPTVPPGRLIVVALPIFNIPAPSTCNTFEGLVIPIPTLPDTSIVKRISTLII